MNALTITNLDKIYASGTKALKGVSLDVASGDFFGLLGPNGAGKTTLIGILTGLINKTSGRALIYNHDIDSESGITKKLVGVVPQEFNFNIFEKVIDIVVCQAGYFGIPYKHAVKSAEEILTTLHLWDKRNTPSRELSGGMKRRLMIARALIHEPKLLFLDEPTAGVDVELRHSMWGYLKKLNRSGTTIFLTTHYIEEAEQLCQNVAIIKKGEIVRKDSVKNLLESIEKKTYIVTVDSLKKQPELKSYQLKIIDEKNAEVSLETHQTITDFINELTQTGTTVKDIRSKRNRLEQLFLNIVKS